MTTIEGYYVNEKGKKKYGSITFNNKGKITDISSKRKKPAIIFPKDCVIFPGFVDIHVHAREDRTKEWNYKEDFRTAGLAAINGGITAFMEMPNTPEPVLNASQVKSRQLLARKSKVPVIIACGINKNSRPVLGVNNYKAYLTKSVGDLFFENTKDFAKQLQKYSNYRVHVHCEDHKIIEWDPLERPAKAEVKAIREVAKLAKKAKVHICHVSTAAGAKLAKKAKLSFEVTPHHLYFTHEDMKKDPLLKMNPPLRTKKDRNALLKLFKAGKIDVLATDHAPHTLDEKQSANPSGVPELDTYGPFVAWLIRNQKVPLKVIAHACSTAPSKLLGLNQGAIKKGMDASFTVLNLKRPITITKKMLKTKCGWSPFEDVTFPGRVEATIVRGKVYRSK
ncbi:MAG: amidohydrolase [Nanoarchaeota archaeon]|nr:MAG: amidohydrolase [Nanoarchaeota archaeon]